LIPKLNQAFPNGSTIIKDALTVAPTAIFNASGIYLHIEMDLYFEVKTDDDVIHFAYDTIGGMDLQLSELNLTTEGTQGYKLFGKAHATESNFQLTASGIPGLTADDVKGIWGLVVYGAADQSFNNALKKGIAIPQIPFVQILDTSLTMYDRTLLAQMNVLITGPS